MSMTPLEVVIPKKKKEF